MGGYVEADATSRVAVGARLPARAALGLVNAEDAGVADAAAHAIAGVARWLCAGPLRRAREGGTFAVQARPSVQTALVRIRPGEADVPLAAPAAGGGIARGNEVAAGVSHRIADLKSFGRAVLTRLAERAALSDGPAGLADAGGVAAPAGAGGRVARGAVRCRYDVRGVRCRDEAHVRRGVGRPERAVRSDGRIVRGAKFGRQVKAGPAAGGQGERSSQDETPHTRSMT